MNERMRELFLKAEFHSIGDETQTKAEFNSKFIPMFAELIVKDVRWVMQTAADDFILDKNYNAVKGVGRCMRRVKQHFGVEE